MKLYNKKWIYLRTDRQFNNDKHATVRSIGKKEIAQSRNNVSWYSDMFSATFVYLKARMCKHPNRYVDL